MVRRRWIETPEGVAADLNRYDDEQEDSAREWLTLYRQRQEREIYEIMVEITYLLSRRDKSLLEGIADFERERDPEGWLPKMIDEYLEAWS